MGRRRRVDRSPEEEVANCEGSNQERQSLGDMPASRHSPLLLYRWREAEETKAAP
jgi:hypothetical protein